MTYGITGEDWLQATLSHLLAFHRLEQDLLATPLTDTTGTSVVVTDGTIAALNSPGIYIEIDQELLYVRSYNSTSKTLTVLRGQQGSTAATHAANAVITVNPRFPRYRIFGALNNVLNDISGSAYFTFAETNLTWDPNVWAYDLGDSAALDVYQVTFPLNPTSTTKWQQMDQGFSLIQGLDTSVFPSGIALQFSDPPGVQSGQPIRVRYKKAFTALPDLTTDVSATGIPLSGTDIPPLGAAIRMMLGRPIKRSFVEGEPEPRRGSEVPPGAIEGSVRLLQMMFDQRLKSEIRELALMWPARKKQYGLPTWRTRMVR